MEMSAIKNPTLCIPKMSCEELEPNAQVGDVRKRDDKLPVFGQHGVQASQGARWIPEML